MRLQLLSSVYLCPSPLRGARSHKHEQTFLLVFVFCGWGYFIYFPPAEYFAGGNATLRIVANNFHPHYIRKRKPVFKIIHFTTMAKNADPKVLWEDTKKWVDQIRKAMNMQQFLHDAQIDENQLNCWYSAFDAASSDITTKLRTHIKVVLDKKKKEDDANTRGPVFFPHMLHVNVAKAAATKAKEYVFVPVVVPAGEPVQVPVHKPVPMPAGEPVQVPVHNDCKACTTGRHITHTCPKGGSRKQCKRKASVDLQAEERDNLDRKVLLAFMERRWMVQCQKLAIKLNTQAEFDSIIAGMDKELPGIEPMKICALTPFNTLIVNLSTPMAEK